MIRFLVFVACALTVMLMVLGIDAANAQGPIVCGAHDKLVDMLERKYSEVLVGGGNTRHGVRTELYVNPEIGSYSILQRMTPRKTCLVNSGIDWQFHSPKNLKNAGQET